MVVHHIPLLLLLLLLVCRRYGFSHRPLPGTRKEMTRHDCGVPYGDWGEKCGMCGQEG